MILALLLTLILLAEPDDGVYTASTSAGPRYAPKLAFDGDPATRWSAAFNERSGWIQIEYKTDKTFDTVVILGEGPELKGMPGKIRIFGLKAETWYPLRSELNKEGPEISISFDQTTSRAWKIQVDSVVNPRWSPTIAEINFRSSREAEGDGTGRPAVAGTKAPFAPRLSASGEQSERFAPAMAVDGDLNTKWQAPRGQTEGWLRLDFPEPMRFNFLSFDVNSESGYGVPREYRLEVLKGKSWKKVLEVDDGNRHFCRKAFRATKGKSWRLAVQKVINARYSLALSEIRLSQEEDPHALALIEPPPPSSPSAKQIRGAIERGRNYLVSEQSAAGTWDTPHTESYPVGVAALGALTLIKSGLQPSDPAVAKALQQITGQDGMKTVYGTALAMMALHETGQDEFQELIEEGARLLIAWQDGTGLWGYPSGRPDHSNAQYALLGLHAAAESGISVPEAIWTKARKTFIRTQLKDGGWNYVPAGKRAQEPATGSMTAAGIASLLLCRHHSSKPSKPDEKAVDRALEQGLAWLGENFTIRLNPGSPEGLGHYYTLYGIERVGKFANRTKIGQHGWYSEGAAHLCRFQRRDGGWQGSMVDTCFALLFLTQASRPLSGE